MTRRIPGNGRVVTTVWFDADRQSQALAASLAVATAPFSPMSAGVHNPSTQPRGYGMVAGYGVNRYGDDVGPLQRFYGAIQPIAQPLSPRLGFGQGVSGQPGMPQAGQNDNGLAFLSLGQLNNVGMGT